MVEEEGEREREIRLITSDEREHQSKIGSSRAKESNEEMLKPPPSLLKLKY